MLTGSYNRQYAIVIWRYLARRQPQIAKTGGGVTGYESRLTSAISSSTAQTAAVSLAPSPCDRAA